MGLRPTKGHEDALWQIRLAGGSACPTSACQPASPTEPVIFPRGYWIVIELYRPIKKCLQSTPEIRSCRLNFKFLSIKFAPNMWSPPSRELLTRCAATAGPADIRAGPRTFANTMEPLDALTERLDYAVGIARHLEAVATTPALRAAYNAVQPRSAPSTPPCRSMSRSGMR